MPDENQPEQPGNPEADPVPTEESGGGYGNNAGPQGEEQPPGVPAGSDQR